MRSRGWFRRAGWAGLSLTFALAAAIPALAQRAAENPDVWIANRARIRINEFYASPVTSDTWGQERLQGQRIGTGRRDLLRLEREQGCQWDLRAVYDDGREEEKRNLNLCTLEEVVFDGSASRAPQPPAAAAPARPPAQAQIPPQPAPVQPAPSQPPPAQPATPAVQPPRPATPAAPGPGSPPAAAAPPSSSIITAPGVTMPPGMPNLSDIPLFGPPTPPAAAATRPAERAADAMLINHGPAMLVSLYAQPATRTDWGEDLLGRGILRPMARFPLRFPAAAGCLFNLRLVFAGGFVDTRTGVDLCANPDVTAQARSEAGQVISYATGLYVSQAGHVLTSLRSVQNCTTVSLIRASGQRVALQAVDRDGASDLALFRVPDIVSPAATFRATGSPVAVGERITLAAYPAKRPVGAVTVVEGTVAAPTGPDGHPAFFQFEARGAEDPLGAPVFDQSGLVIGLAADPHATARYAEAVQRVAIARLLSANNIRMAEAAEGARLRMPNSQDYAFPLVLPLDCRQ